MKPSRRSHKKLFTPDKCTWMALQDDSICGNTEFPY